MRKHLQVIAVLSFLTGVLYLVEAHRYPRGTMAQPGPGLYPLLVGGLLAFSALGVGLEAAHGRLPRSVPWPEGTARWRVSAVVVATLGYILLLPYTGHPLAAALVTLVTLQVMGLPSWPLKVTISLLVASGSHYVFAVLLGVPLPMGVWFR